MSLNSTRFDFRRRGYVAASVIAVLISSIFASAQPRRARPAGGKKQEQSKSGPVKFGDITISHFDRLNGTFGSMAEARGPNTTIDMADPKEPLAKTRLNAEYIKATMDENSKGGEVERIEASGNFRIHSTRPAPNGGGTQVLDASGVKAVYNKKTGQVTLEGPIEYHGQLIDPKGTVVQSIKGTAKSGSYNENTQVLSLVGDVNATAMMPSLKSPGTLTGATDLTVDLSKQPLGFEIKGGQVRGEPKEQPKKDTTKQPDKKKNP